MHAATEVLDRTRSHEASRKVSTRPVVDDLAHRPTFRKPRGKLSCMLVCRLSTCRQCCDATIAIPKGASPNYFFQNNVIVTLSWNPPPPNVTPCFLLQEMKYEIQDIMSIV